MKDMELVKALEKKYDRVHWFETGAEAVAYLKGAITNTTVGFGDSQTLDAIGLQLALEETNVVYNPSKTENNDQFLQVAKQCLTTDVFLTSVNALTRDGILVNMDGTGNRVAGSLFGHRKVYYVIGTNKVAENLEAAYQRIKEVAAPKNAQRLKLKTPCAIRGDKCYHCNSPERICNGLLVQYRKMNDIEMEAILIDEVLGY